MKQLPGDLVSWFKKQLKENSDAKLRDSQKEGEYQANYIFSHAVCET